MDLITGASGFIGSRLARHFAQLNRPCLLLSGKRQVGLHARAVDITSPFLLPHHLTGIDSLFHCAGYAHAFHSLSQKDVDQYWRVNFQGTRNLVEAAGKAGVQCFIFLSSVKAMGDPDGLCADEDFPTPPATPYGQSKRAAEKSVLEAGYRYGMKVVNLRLAMVYGAGGRGNLERMGKMIKKGGFPPLPETGNHRSLVHVDDVVAAICAVANDARANGRTYIITGPDAPSGRELYDAMCHVLGKPKRHWSVPEWVLRIGARCGDRLEARCNCLLPFNSQVVDRLLGSAWYSSDRIKRELGWVPQVILEKGLQEMFGSETQF